MHYLFANGVLSEFEYASPHGATFNSNNMPGRASTAHNRKKLPQPS